MIADNPNHEREARTLCVGMLEALQEVSKLYLMKKLLNNYLCVRFFAFPKLVIMFWDRL